VSKQGTSRGPYPTLSSLFCITTCLVLALQLVRSEPRTQLTYYYYLTELSEEALYLPALEAGLQGLYRASQRRIQGISYRF
jgi:hypothetical protein